jgi:hypothetical protein
LIVREFFIVLIPHLRKFVALSPYNSFPHQGSSELTLVWVLVDELRNVELVFGALRSMFGLRLSLSNWLSEFKVPKIDLVLDLLLQKGVEAGCIILHLLDRLPLITGH